MRILPYIISILTAMTISVFALYGYVNYSQSNVTAEPVVSDILDIKDPTPPLLIEEEIIEAPTTSPTTTEEIVEEAPPIVEEVVMEEIVVIFEEPEVEIVIPEPTPEVVVEEILPPPPELELTEEDEISWSEVNLAAREALVNILCLTTGNHNYIAPISGSGVIIDERGVILTNAHIGQYYLFENYPEDGFVNCLIRTGSPAEATYKASLLHISPEWIRDNAEAIATENPTGTGEHDFAFLIIDEAIDGSLPETFPFVQYDVREETVIRDMDILLAAYPAGFLGASTIQKSLYAASAITKVFELYRFTEIDRIDAISLGGTVVAQQGSSGGGVFTKSLKLIGIISTSSTGESTADRDLRAITLAHIDKSMQENSNFAIRDLLEGDMNVKAAAFNAGAASTLLQILVSSFN